MAAERFQTQSDQEIAKLLTEKDSENTQKATKGCRLLFDEYLKEKHIQFCPETANELANVLKKFYAEVRKKDGNPFVPSGLVSIDTSKKC